MDLGNWMNKILIGWGVDPKIANTFDEAIIAVLMICIAVGLDYLCQSIFVGGMKKYTKHSPHVWNTLLMKRRVFHNLIHTIPGILIYALLPMAFVRGKELLLISQKICAIYIIMSLLLALNGVLLLITDDNEEKNTETNTFQTKDYSLLVVDDNQDLIDFLRDTMKVHFKQVYTAADGVEALEIVRKYQPDIVVSDVMMPRMNGYELCKQIKENIDISHIPVILLTARDDEQSQLHGYKIGADGYLTKPFEEEMLLELIRSRLRNREQTKVRYLNAGLLPAPEESTFSQADETFLLKLNKIIVENLDSSVLDIAFLCKEMYMSRATLYNKLKALTDMGANDYINKFRLERAIQLITTTDLNFTEIAERTGFSTSRYFSTAFKQYTGETPTQYKESHKRTS